MRASARLTSWAGPLSALAAATVFAAIVVLKGYVGLGEAHEKREQAAARRAEARARLNQVDEERRLIERYAPAYTALLESGVVGPEQRVNWIDAVRVASQSLGGFAVEYRLDSRQPGSFAGLPAGVKLGQSTMSLYLRLLHEGDLLAFLAALEEARAGLFLPRSCTIERLVGGPFSVRVEPKLAAECELAWITLAPTTDSRP